MKGTLFSADFVKDSSNNLRLLELNTDTTILDDKLNDIQLGEFINVLSQNNITTLDIIYKPFFQQKLVSKITDIIKQECQDIDINTHEEDRHSIYPVSLEDAPNKFILRLAYDEAAIFDSEYAKTRLNVFNLFNNGIDQNKTVGYYYANQDGVKNTLSYELNDSNIPDATIKDLDEQFNPIDFFKIGSKVEGESNQQRWEKFIEENSAEDKVIEQYHVGSDTINELNKITGIRTVSIVYGSDLNVINIIGYKAPAALDVPSNVSSEVDMNSYTNKLADHHYYEFATNYPSKGNAGMLSSHEVKTPSGAKLIGDLEVGEEITSYQIAGAPQIESDLETFLWNTEGNTLPEGSALTSASVVFTEKSDLKYGGLVELKVDGDSVYSGVNKQYLVYDSENDTTKFKLASEINPETDSFFDYNANLLSIDEANFFVTSDMSLNFTEIDVEDADTYLINGSTAFNSLVTHNAPCFKAGSKINLGNGEQRNIEDIKIGDEVLTYNFEKGQTEIQKVSAIGARKVANVVEYVFDDGSKLEATPDHPLYCKSCNSWASSDPDYTRSVYNLTTVKIEVGCRIAKYDGTAGNVKEINFTEGEVTVYNLRSVDCNHNFFVNDYLAHNRCFVAGTEINMADGTAKKIEHVEAGDEVLSYDFKNFKDVTGVVGGVKEHEVDNIIFLTFNNERIVKCTPEHPFYVKQHEGWIEAKELKMGDECFAPGDGEEASWYVSTVQIEVVKTTVYNLLGVEEHNNYYANKVLVHNKK